MLNCQKQDGGKYLAEQQGQSSGKGGCALGTSNGLLATAMLPAYTSKAHEEGPDNMFHLFRVAVTLRAIILTKASKKTAHFYIKQVGSNSLGFKQTHFSPILQSSINFPAPGV